MIEKIYKNKRMVVCDNCGTGQECDSWAEVIDFMNEEGWKKKLFDGEWKHFRKFIDDKLIRLYIGYRPKYI